MLVGDEELVLVHGKIPCTGQRSRINNNVVGNGMPGAY